MQHCQRLDHDVMQLQHRQRLEHNVIQHRRHDAIQHRKRLGHDVIKHRTRLGHGVIQHHQRLDNDEQQHNLLGHRASNALCTVNVDRRGLFFPISTTAVSYGTERKKAPSLV